MPVSESKDTFLSGLCTIIKINIESLLILKHCTQRSIHLDSYYAQQPPATILFTCNSPSTLPLEQLFEMQI